MSIQPSSLRQALALPTNVFHPQQTVRCAGAAVFRNQLARDIACILDVDDTVVSWSCFSTCFRSGDYTYRPDIIVEHNDGTTVIEVVCDEPTAPVWLADVLATSGYRYERLGRTDLPPIRLRNAKDLLRYARYEVGLDDRVRLLAALDEHGTLSLAECLSAFRNSSPIPGVASLILGRFLSADLDQAPIGPETILRRFQP